MMQAVLPKWKCAFVLKKIAVQSSTIATRIPHFHSFNSTPTLETSKANQDNSDKTEHERPAGKTDIRYISRKKQKRLYSKQVRVDAKRALTSGVDVRFKPLTRRKEFGRKERREEEETDDSGKKPRSKASARREAKRQQRERRENNYEQFDETPNIFHAIFGNRHPNVSHANLGNNTWAFRSSEDPPSQSSTTGFEWREKSRWSGRKPEPDIEIESDDESCLVCNHSDRMVLGLPAKGPLKMDDVKNAFRLSALKWHPDRHQGRPTQVTAEDKFKRCVDAYKSLCDALSMA